MCVSAGQGQCPCSRPLSQSACALAVSPLPGPRGLQVILLCTPSSLGFLPLLLALVTSASHILLAVPGKLKVGASRAMGGCVPLLSLACSLGSVWRAGGEGDQADQPVYLSSVPEMPAAPDAQHQLLTLCPLIVQNKQKPPNNPIKGPVAANTE